MRSFEKKPIFCLSPIRGRQGEEVLIIRCVGDCGGLRRFLRGFHLSAFTYTPDPAVYYILFRGSEHKNQENVLDRKIIVPDRPTGGLLPHPSLKISIIHHTDIPL